MLLILLAFPWSFNNFLYKGNITYVYERNGNILLRNLYYGNIYLATDSVITGKSLSDAIFLNAYRNAISRSFSENLRKQLTSMEGIIPDIELPLKLPGALKQILGEGGTIKVSGHQTVSLEVTQKVQENVLNGSFLDIKPDQDLDVVINGTVGQKIHIDVNYNVKRLDETQNKVKVYYQSNDEDDILQYINLGDTDNKGKFGITARGKFANTDFNFALTRVKSLPEEKSSEFSAEVESLIIYDNDYVKDKFYYLPMGQNDSLVLLRVYYQVTASVTYITARTFKVNGDSGDVARFELKEEGDNADYRIRYFQYYYGIPRPFLEIINPPENGRIIGVYYITKNVSTGVYDTVGYLAPGPEDTSRLLLLKASDPSPEDTTWYLMMRNVYAFPKAGGITNFELQVYKVVPGGEPVSFDENTGIQYIKILGLDQDSIPGVDAEKFVDFQNGYVFFPYAYPFLMPALAPDTVPAIYRKKYPEADEKNKYFIMIKYKSPLTKFTIGGGNSIVENSEVIVIDGDTLKRDIDYTINYETGEVSIKDPSRFPPDAKVNYSYQVITFGGMTYSQDYLTKLETKTYLNDKTAINTSINFNASSVNDFYPKLGSEPVNYILANSSFNTGIDLGFLTPIFSRLPIIGSEKPSALRISGNISLSLPNPSTKGKGYIDDMESIKKTENFGTTMREWFFSSTPDGKDEYLLGEIHWWNINLMESDIFPYVSGDNNPVGAMNIYFDPRNKDPNSWGGIIYSFGSTSKDMSKDQAIEMWVRADSGILHIDLGTDISEDAPRLNAEGEVIPADGIMENEDVNRSGRLETGEDVGIDGVSYPDSLYQSGGKDAGDDGNDDYPEKSPSSFEDSLKLNGTEGNKRIDTEDINHDDIFNIKNNYYSFRVDIKDTRYVIAEGKNGWKKLRILLDDTNIDRTVGNPSWNNIRYVRVWIDGVSGPTRIQVARWGVVGSVWRNEGIFSTTGDSVLQGENFVIGYRSTGEDSLYVPPVERERTSYGGYREETSLEFVLDSILPTHIVRGTEYFDRPRDLRNYKKIVFFVKKLFDKDAKIYFRFGTDTLNYYQYEFTVNNDKWDTVALELSRFTELKLGKTLQNSYSYKGNPTMKQIYFIQFGVENTDTLPTSGSVLFDDVYLSDPHREPDVKYSYSLKGNFGENISYTVSESYKGEHYKGTKGALRTPGEDRNRTRNVSLNLILSRLTGGYFKLPLKYSLSISKNIPFYYRNSDILLPDSLRERESSYDRIESGSFNISPSDKVKTSMLKYIFSGINLSGSVRRKKSYKPYLSADTLISTGLSGGYNPVLPSPKLFFLSPLPKKISLSGNYQFTTEDRYNYNNLDSLFVKQEIKDIKNLKGTFSTTYNPLSFLTISYTKNVAYDRTVPFDRRLGWLKNSGERLSVQTDLNLLSLDRVSLRYTSFYKEDKDYQYARTFGDSVNIRKAGVVREISTGHNITIDKFMKYIPLVNLFFKDWSPLQLRFSHSLSNTYAYLRATPDYRFRYGIDIFPSSQYIFRNYQTDGGKKSIKGELSTGFTFWKIKPNIKISRTEEYPIINLSSQHIVKWTLPDISLRTSAFTPIIKKTKIFKGVDINLSYTRDTTFTLFLNDTTRKRYSSNERISPSIDLTLKNNMKLSVKGSYNLTGTRDIQANTELLTRSSNWNIDLSTGFSITPSSGIKFPFTKRKIRLRSNLNMKITGSLKGKRDYVYNAATKQKDIRTDYLDGEINLSGTYTLSRSVDITMSTRYTKHINWKLDTDRRHSFGLKISGKLKF